jgi:hypothetical protein
MTSSAPYLPVLPIEHDASCRRGLDGASPHYGVDRQRCERCRNLWARLDEAHERNVARRAARQAATIAAS